MNLPKGNPDDYFKEHGWDPSSVSLDAKFEQPEELKARLEKEKALYNSEIKERENKNKYLRTKEASIYALAGLLVFLLAMVSVIAVVNPHSTEDQKKLASSTLIALTSSVGSYLFGKASSS